MILQALEEHYWRLSQSEDSGIAQPGYSSAKVSHVLVLDVQGMLVDIWKLTKIKGKKELPQMLEIPEQVSRTSGISANILCDNAAYVLSIEKNKNGIIDISPSKYTDFQQKNLKFLAPLSHDAVKAVCRFLNQWRPEMALTHPVVAAKAEELASGSNLVFKLDGTLGYVHETTEFQSNWKNRGVDSKEAPVAQCLLTGEVLPIARIHPLIKGVVGSQTSGAAIVSFNADAFTSYGKSQSYNAPVSTKAAFAYGTALNYLLSSESNRIRLADTTVVFWADKQSKIEETTLAWSFDPVDPEDAGEAVRRIDSSAAAQAKNILENIKAGKPVEDAEFDLKTRCYLLGLAPNAARLAVRFWQVSSFGDVLEKIVQHYCDMEINGIERIGGFVSPWRVLKALAVQEDPKNIPPLLAGQFLKSVLAGSLYPQSLYHVAVHRCRTGGEHGGVTTIRAAVIKAVLTRKFRAQGQREKEEAMSMSLWEDNPNTGYQLGRLFYLLEKVQKDALGDLNASIRDRYFGSASATPRAIFPLLLRLSRHHIAKAKYGAYAEKGIQEVANRLKEFPAQLNLENQGQFILGYYHQKQAQYGSTKEGKEAE